MDLSIIIPIFNGKEYIDSLIDSILDHNSQSTVFKYELIIVDDGSTDNSSEMIDEYRKKTPAIKLIRQEQMGVAQARNTGLDNACGKYVTFADQDDLVIDGYLPFIRTMDDLKCDLLITSPRAVTVDAEPVPTWKYSDTLCEDRTVIKRIARKMVSQRLAGSTDVPTVGSSVWNCIFRRSFIEENGIRFKRFIDYEDDWIFMIECLSNAQKIMLSHKTYYQWLVRQGSESHRYKYINDLLIKRVKWTDWLKTTLTILDLPKEELCDYLQIVIYPRNIMICYKNACFAPDSCISEVIDEVKTACDYQEWEGARYNSVKEMDSIDKLLFSLLTHKSFFIAVLLNRYIIKRHFH